MSHDELFGKEYITRMKCPKCGSTSVKKRGKEEMVYPTGCLAVAAPFLLVFHYASCPVDYECTACNHYFARRSLPAQILLYGILAAIVIFFIVAVIEGRISPS